MSYEAQQHAPLWSPELYALGTPPMWVVWALLCGGVNYCEHAGRLGWTLAQLAARPCLAWWLPAH